MDTILVACEHELVLAVGCLQVLDEQAYSVDEALWSHVSLTAEFNCKPVSSFLDGPVNLRKEACQQLLLLVCQVFGADFV